jgi:hypothetical protein
VKYIDIDGRRPPATSMRPAAPGALCQIATRRSASGYGSGFSSTLLTTPNTAVLAPLAVARVNIATIVNSGLRRSVRSA